MATVKPRQFGNKNKSTAKKNVKTVETKKSSTNTALKSKGQKKSVQVSTGWAYYCLKKNMFIFIAKNFHAENENK